MVLIILLVVGGFVKVIVESHESRDRDDHRQQKKIEQDAARYPVSTGQTAGDADDQKCRCDAKPELPGPEHEIEMVLTAHLAPEGEYYLQSDRNSKIRSGRSKRLRMKCGTRARKES